MNKSVALAGFGAGGVLLSDKARVMRRASLLAATALVGVAAPAHATDYTATTYAELVTAINAVNAGTGADRIIVNGNIALTGLLPAVRKGVTVIGNGNTISGAGAYRIFFIDAGTAAVSLQGLTLTNGLAQGGGGSEGGGGGMGAGGAIFVNSGAVTATNVSFSGNRAVGGLGGAVASGPDHGGGGGGGLGGSGGSGGSVTSGGGGGYSGGGGGGGGGGFGGAGPGGAGGNAGQAGANGGGGVGAANGCGAGSVGGGGGGAGGGAGTGGFCIGGGGGGGGGYTGVGGQGGGYNSFGQAIAPGAGTAGGGGGGNWSGTGGAGGDFGGGGGGRVGGAGGYGGGGGGGNYQFSSPRGGQGGFGGGGGGGIAAIAAGGIGGGASGSDGSGGGGAGFGGDVFVRGGGGASFAVTSTANTSLSGGAVSGGASLGAGNAGAAAGAGIFLGTGANISFDVAAGATTTVGDAIADSSAATLPGGGYTAGSGAGATLTKNGAGTLVLNASNSVGGGATVNAGTLQLGGTASAGDVYLRGGQLTLTSTAAVSGTIHAIDPTVNFAATGIYADPVSLEVPAGSQATDPTILNNTSGGAITLSGTIAEGAGFTGQYVTFGGTAGATTSLTNAANSWTGVTTINSGVTLRGTSAAAVSGSSIVDNGTLAYSIGTAQTASQAISGTGALAVSGGGFLTLTGDNSYTGGTTVAGATTLSIGNGTTAGAITGPITATESSVAFNRNDGYVNNSAITATTPSGFNGKVYASGRLTLNGAISAAGGVEVQAFQTGAPGVSYTMTGSTITLGGTVNGSTSAADGGYGSAVAVQQVDATLNVAASGQVQGGSFIGVRLAQGGGVVNNLGSITNTGTGGADQVGAGVAVYATAGTTTIVNGSITNGTATISGRNNAINQRGSAATALTINNYGTLTSTLYSAFEDSGSAGALTVNNLAVGATIYGGGLGVAHNASSALTVQNAGRIVGQNGGLFSNGAASITNAGTIGAGTISGGTFTRAANAGTGITMQGGTVTNLAGQITSGSTGGYGVSGAGSALLTVDNRANAVIQGGATGVYSTAQSNTILNAGTITGAGTGQMGVWIVNAAGTNEITNSGSITGGFSGVYGGNSLLTVANTGTITGQAGTGVDLFGNGSVTNSGTVAGAIHAVYADSAAPFTLDNQSGGALTSTNSFAVRSRSADVTITNAGSITAANGAATAVSLEGTGPQRVTNTGTIRGSNGIVATAGAATLVQNGTITAGSGFAVQTGASDDRLTLGATSVTTGNIDLGDGADTLTFNLGAAVTGTIAGGLGADTLTFLGAGASTLPTSISGFETVNQNGSGTLTITGTNTGVTAINANAGVLIFNNTTGLTSAIAVNGGVIRATSAGAFGTGTITTIDPTVQYAATGSFANDIVLSAIAPATDPTVLQTFGTNITATLTGAISEATAGQPLQFSSVDAAGVANTGTFVLQPSAAASYTGATTINTGTTVIERNVGNALGTGTVTIASGATLQFDKVTGGSYNVAQAEYAGSGTLRFTSASGARAFFEGTGGGRVTVNLGSGALIDVASGQVQGSSNFGGVWTNNLADLTIAGGATFLGLEGTIRVDALNGAGTLSGGYTNGSNTVGSTTIGVDNGSGLFSGTIVDGGTGGANARLVLIKTGTGTQTLSGVNTYTGSTTIAGGTLALSGAGSIANSAVTNNATLDVSGTTTGGATIASLAGSGTVKLGAGVLTVGGDNASTTFSGNIADGAPLSYVGSWQVSNGPAFGTRPATYTAQEAAVLLFGGTAGAYRISTVSANPAQLNDLAWYSIYGVAWQTHEATYRVDQGLPGYSQSGDSSAYVRDFIDATKINYAFTGGTPAGGGLTKTGSGTLTLTGANSWTGVTTIGGGTLQGTSASISGGSIVDDAVLAYVQTASGTVAQNISGTGTVTVSGLAAGNALTFSGALSNSGGLTVGADSAVILSGTDSGTGGIRLTGANAAVSVTATGSYVASGAAGVLGSAANQSVSNLGTIQSTGGGRPVGVALDGGGTITNGSASNHAALIRGANSASNNLNGAALVTVNNYAQIRGDSFNGIDSTGALTVNNYAGGKIAAGAPSTGEGVSGTTLTVRNAAGGGGVAAGQIVGGYVGAQSRGTADIVNSGLIGSGTLDLANAGTAVTSGYTAGGVDGIRLLGNGGSVTNNAGAQISGGTGSALYVEGNTATDTRATVINTGAMSAAYGIYSFGSSINGNRPVALAITNNAAGTIVGLTNQGIFDGGGAITLGNAGTIVGATNAVEVAAGVAGTSIINSGTISSGTYDAGTGTITAGTGGSGVYLSATGDVTNQTGGLIQGSYGVRVVGGTVTNQAGATLIGTGNSAVEADGVATFINAGTATAQAFSGAYFASAGANVLQNTGTITGGSNGARFEGATGSNGSVVNSGSIIGSTTNGILSAAGLDVTNNAGGTIRGATYGVAVSGGALTLDNSGTITGTNGTAILTTGAFANSVTLRAGSTTSGAISFGAGDDTLAIYNGSGGAASFGAIDGGVGNDTLVLRGTGDGAAAGAAGSFDLATGVGFDALRKRDSGTWTLTGVASNALRVAPIYAGAGSSGGNAGLLIFDGTTGLTGGIYVNGGVIRSTATGSFGTGTIHLVDPTVQFAATQTSGNAYALEVASPASADPSVFQTTGAFTVTLDGAIATGTGPNVNGQAVDPTQYVTFDGATGSRFVLTNAGNSWTGVTRINGGITLQGTTATISGGSVVADGVLAFNQSTSGSFAPGITGTGSITVTGTGAETVTLAGNNAVAGGITLTDSSRVRFSGANSSSTYGVLSNGLVTAVTVDAGATLISTASDGARFQGGAGAVSTFTNAGTTGAITADAGNAVTVTNLTGGLIQRTFAGSAIDSGGGQLTVVNQTGADIIGYSFGIIGRNALDSVDNNGRIAVGTLAGGVGSALTLNGGQPGVGLLNGGTVTNRSNGLITSSGDAVQGGGALTVTNDGTLSGGRIGVLAYNNAVASVTNGGTIVGSGIDGVQIGSGSVSNSGSITGARTGIFAYAAPLTLTNSGTIIGNDAAAIYANSSVTLTGNTGTIRGQNTGTSADGIYASTGLSGTNSGLIESTSNSRSGIYSNGAVVLTNTAGGAIRGGYAAIRGTAGTDITNAGSIVGYAGGGVFLDNGGTVTNQVTGTISGVDSHAIRLGAATGTVNNAGSLSSANADAVWANDGTTLNLTNSGSIAATLYAAVTTKGGTIANTGLIAGGTDGTYGYGVQAGTGVTIANQGGGVVTGFGAATIFGAGTAVTNQAGAVMAGTGVGVTASVTTNITNAGTIGTGTVSGGAFTAGTTGNAVTVVGGGLTNTGTIDGGGRGVFVASGTETLTNTGVIQGRSDDAVLALGNVSVLNGGRIESGVNSGIAVGNAATATITNAVGGSFIGGSSTTYGYGIQSNTTGLVTVDSYGSATGSQGGILSLGAGAMAINLYAGSTTDAVRLGGADDTVSLYTGNNNAAALTTTYTDAVTGAVGTVVLQNAGSNAAAVVGTIDLGGGSNTLNLNGSGDGTAANGAAGTLANGSIAGATAINKNGTGTWTLSGTASAGTGAVTVNGGRLNVAGGDAIADTAIVTVNTNGTLGLLANEAIGTLAGNGAVALGANTLTLAGNGDSTFTGVASGTGGLTKQGAGTLTLSGANSFTGTLLIAGGTVAYGADDVLADTATVTVNASTTFDLNGHSDTIGTLNLYGTLANGGALTAGSYNAFAGSTIGQRIASGTLNVYGNTALTAATLADPINIYAGTLSTSSAELLGDAAAVNIAAAGTLAIGGNETIGSLADLPGGGGTVQLGANTLTVAGTASTGFSGVVAGTGGLTKTGTGTLTLTGVNTFAGTTTIGGGTLAVGGGNAIADGGTVQVNAGGTLQLNANERIATLGGTGNVALGANTLFLGTNGASSTFGGVASGTGGLTQTGTGTLTLSGANTYTGTTLISGSTLTFGASDVLADGSALLVQNGTVNLGANSDTVDHVGLIGGTLNGTGTLTATGASGVAGYALADAVINANLGTGSLAIVSGNGNTVLNGTAAATSVEVQQGSLTLGASNRLADTATVYVDANGTLALGANTDTVASLNLYGTLTGSGTLTAGNYLLLGGTATGNLGAGTLTAAHNPATPAALTTVSTLNGTSAATAVQVNSGATLALGAGERLADTAAVDVGAGGVLDLGAFNETVGSLDLSGTLNGAGTLTAGTYRLTGGTANANLGAGTLNQVAGISTLNGTAAAGNVDVQGGTLLLGNNERLADDAVLAVQTGATLDLGAFAETVGSVTLNGTLNGTGTLTAATYALNGATVIGNLGAGTLNQESGTSTLTGTAGAATVNVNGGTLALGRAERLADTAGLTIAGGAVLDLGLYNETVGSAQINGMLNGAGTLTAGSYTLNGATVNGNLGAGTLSQDGTTSTLFGSSAAGTVVIDVGTLALGGSERLADTAALTIENGGTLDLRDHNETVDTATIRGILESSPDRTGTLTARTYTLDGGVFFQNFQPTVYGNLGAGTLNVQGKGVATLYGTAAAGTVAINGGTLLLGGDERLDNNAAVTVTGGVPGPFGSGGILDVGTHVETVGTLQLTQGTLAGTGTLNAMAYGLTDATVIANLGTGVLTQQAGTSTLSGAALAETVKVDGGTLRLGANDRLADTAAVTVASGAVLDLGTFSDTVGTLALNGTLAGTNGATLTADSYTLNGAAVIANLGTGTLTQAGGTSTLTGRAAATLVNVDAGTLLLAADDRLADTAAVRVASGGTLDLAGFAETVGSLTLGGTLNGTGSTLTAGTYTLTGGTANANLGAGALVQESGTSTLNGRAAASTVDVNGGTLTLGAADRLADTATLRVASGGTLDLAGFAETVGSLTLGGTLNGTGSTLTAGTYTLTGGTANANLGAGALVQASGASTLNGTSAAASLTVTGGALRLNGAAAATAVNVNAGTLTLGAANRLADNAAVSVGTNGILDLGAFAETVGNATLNGTLNGTGTLTAATYALNGATVNGNLGVGTLTQTGGASTLNGTAAAASLAVTGGTLLLNGTAAATTVDVTAGTLALGAANRLADNATVSVGTNGILDLGAFGDTIGTLALNGTLNGTGTLTAGTYALNGARVNGNLGAGTLTQAGGTSVLTGSSGAATVAVNAGTLALGGVNRLSDTAAVTVAPGAILDLRSFSDTVGMLALNGTLNGTGTLTAATYALNGATVNGNLGAGTLTQAGGTSTLLGSSGAATVNVAAGTLRLAGDERLADTAALTLAADTALDVNGRTETVGSVNGAGTVALGAGRLALAGSGASSLAALTGTGTLDKTGTGTLTLASSYAATGPIVLSGGTTVFTGMSAGSFRVAGGTLTGTGMAAGALTLTGGTVSPGSTASPFGVLTVGGLNASGGAYAIDFGGAGFGFQSDLLRVNGAATLGGMAAVTANAFVGNERFEQDYLVLQATSLSGTFSNLSTFTQSPSDPFIYYRLRYDLVPNAVVLQVRRQIDFRAAIPNGTPNQLAVASALNGAAGTASDAFAATLNVLAGSNAATRGQTYDSLSGEVIADVTTGALFASDRFVDLMRSRLGLRGGGAAGAAGYALRAGATDGERHASGFAGAMQDGLDAAGGTAGADRSVGLWLQGYGAGRRLEGRTGSGQATTNSVVDGLAGGLDGQIGAVTVGVAGGFSDVESKLRARNARLEGTLYQVGGYLGFDLGTVYGSVAGDYFDGDVTVTRQLAIGGATVGQARGTADVHGYSIGGTLGARFEVGGGTRAGFELTGQQTQAVRRGYTETAPLLLGLTAARDSRDVFTGTAQLKVSHLFTGNGWTAEPYASGGLQINAGDLATVNAMQFGAAPTGTGAFLVQGTRLERSLGVFTGGVEIRPSDKFRIDVSAGGAIGNRTHEGQVKVSARLGF